MPIFRFAVLFTLAGIALCIALIPVVAFVVHLVR